MPGIHPKGWIFAEIYVIIIVFYRRVVWGMSTLPVWVYVLSAAILVAVVGGFFGIYASKEKVNGYVERVAVKTFYPLLVGVLFIIALTITAAISFAVEYFTSSVLMNILLITAVVVVACVALGGLVMLYVIFLLLRYFLIDKIYTKRYGKDIIELN
ncbi:hypothetical protein IJJ53_02365 [Candidatus Saccharibacteria bacterium]|nr:hypothetical protein [Candidatus Saccharibacteria bacterium]